MRITTVVGGVLRTLSEQPIAAEDRRTVGTGLVAIDALLPGGSFASGAVHEVISSTETPSFLLPILIAKSAAGFGHVVWCDSLRQFYPPAAAALGLPLDRLVVLRPPGVTESIWAVTESLRCGGVAACVATLPKLSRVQARRLQLAAERGGGVGLVLRPAAALAWPYAAATRWWVRPAPGDRTTQRWQVEMIHGHGGRVGQSVLVELHRETHLVRATETMAHRSAPTRAAPATA